MKGLLLKDWYMTKKYCRSFLLVAFVFLAISAFDNENMLFLTYPSIFVAMLPMILFGYDEKLKWDVYCGTLPYSKEQMISEKYIFGLITTIPMILITGVLQSIKLSAADAFSFAEVFELMAFLVLAAVLVSGVVFPLMVKFGSEKGRLAYYVMIGFATALAVLLPNVINVDLSGKVSIGFAPAALVAAVVIYALSWYLSIVFYKKREI